MKRFNVVRTAPTLFATVLVTGCAVVSGWIVEESTWDATVVAPPSPPPDRAAATRRPPAPRPDVASWYGSWHHGRPTASGEPFDMDELTAAHRSLPLGACIEVTHLATFRRVYVRVNDRGPYVAGRTIDLSYRAAHELGMVDDGLARVRIRRVRPDACPASEPINSEGRARGGDRQRLDAEGVPQLAGERLHGAAGPAGELLLPLTFGLEATVS